MDRVDTKVYSRDSTQARKKTSGCYYVFVA